MSTGRIFTFEERVGQMFTVIFAGSSILAASFILCFAFTRWLRKVMGSSRTAMFEATDSSLFLNLMLADMVQALGTMPNIRWIKEATITDGFLCRNQGALRHVGVVAVAFSSLFIAIYTFYVLVLRRIPPTHASKIGVLIVWLITGLITGIPNAIHFSRHETFYGPTGFWCWIRYEWRTEQLATMYMWLWICAFSMVFIYGVIFASIRGWIKTPRSGHFKNMSTTSESSSADEEPQYKRTKAAARSMLYFPLVYIIIVFPNSITRWSEFSGHKPPSSATLFANVIFVSSGLANFFLFFATRPRMVIGEKVIIHEARRTVRPQSHALELLKKEHSSNGSKLKHDIGLSPEV